MNELFALHFNGDLIHPDIWKDYRNVRNNFYGFKPPKKIYYTLGDARKGRHHLPEPIKGKVKIVKYVPGEEVE